MVGRVIRPVFTILEPLLAFSMANWPGSMAFDCPKQETIQQGTFGNDFFDKQA
jgi:hypothetical protein